MWTIHKQALPKGFRIFHSGEFPYNCELHVIDTDETLLIKNEFDIMRINIIEVETTYAVNAYMIQVMDTCLAVYGTREDAELVKEDLIKSLKDTKDGVFYFPVDKNLINAIDVCKRQAEKSNEKIEKYIKEYEDDLERSKNLDIEDLKKDLKKKYFCCSALIIGLVTLLNILI